ncbi:MAG TPA: hypothetical protein VFW45_00010 [Candidatus Polarisedimenticolia bacterium]|nr:hypothetical protein [Candidatus Polarisedimenticolia bacterium]
MIAVTGIFKSSTDAENAVRRLRSMGIEGEHRLNILTPRSSDQEIAQVPTSDTEQPGMGAAVGGVVGTVGGLGVGTAVTSLLIPGIGPVVAAGIVAAGILGAVAGAKAGDKLEDAMTDGPPKDEMFLYEDALRHGRSVVIALADGDQEADSVRASLTDSGALDIDAARKSWWIGLRDVEKEHYEGEVGDFTSVEPIYRRGFESAFYPEIRGRSYDDAKEHLRSMHADVVDQEPFQRGYYRGQETYRKLLKK